MTNVPEANERFELSIKLLVIRDNGEVLLLRRPSYVGDLFWDLPGGRLLPGETIETAITRELREEIGWTDILPERRLVEASLWQPNALGVRPKVHLFYRMMIDIEDVVLSAEHVDHTWTRTSKIDELSATARLEPALRDLLLRVNPPSVLDEMLASLEAKQTEQPPLPEVTLQMIRDLDLTSCDFCGDGCCDEDCYRCYSPLRPENLRTLAKNLSAAAMLCRAWNMHDAVPTWRPGCNILEEL